MHLRADFGTADFMGGGRPSSFVGVPKRLFAGGSPWRTMPLGISTWGSPLPAAAPPVSYLDY